MTRHIRLPGSRPLTTYCGAEPTTDDLQAVRATRRRRSFPDVCVDCLTAYEIEMESA